MMTDCPRCHRQNCAQKNGEILGKRVIVVCVQCRKAWIEGDDYLVDPGRQATTKLRARSQTIEVEERYRRFMESDDDVLWERVV